MNKLKEYEEEVKKEIEEEVKTHKELKRTNSALYMFELKAKLETIKKCKEIFKEKEDETIRIIYTYFMNYLDECMEDYYNIEREIKQRRMKNE